LVDGFEVLLTYDKQTAFGESHHSSREAEFY
jgi:hypothetical protein